MHAVSLLRTISGFADQAVILPVVLAVLALLVALGETRAGMWWAAAMAVSLGGTLLAKIAFIPCGHLLPALEVQSPSGHTASAAAVYSGLIVLASQAKGRGFSRLTACSLGGGIVCLVAASRVALHAHTVQETLVGAAIGVLAPVILSMPRPLFVQGRIAERRWLLALPLLLVPLFFGLQLNAESWIAAFAWRVARAVHACGG